MTDLNKNSFEEYVVESGEPCLVIFSKKGCPVCKSVHETLNGLEQEYAGFPFYHVDVEEFPELRLKYRLKGVPQVILFSDGCAGRTFTGELDEDECVDAIEEISDSR